MTLNGAEISHYFAEVDGYLDGFYGQSVAASFLMATRTWENAFPTWLP